MIWQIIGIVFVTGVFGGLGNSLVAGEFQLPRHDRAAGIFRPGWIGTAAVGGIAAVVFWGLYGPFTETVVVGLSDSSNPILPALAVSQLAGALLSGFGGGSLLTTELDKRALRASRDDLGEALQEMAK